MYRALHADPGGRLRFAPLQGETARRHLPSHCVESLESAVLLDEAGVALRSDAVLRAALYLPKRWRRAARILLFVPRPLRDMVYDWVALHRGRLARLLPEPPLPVAAERHRVLP